MEAGIDLNKKCEGHNLLSYALFLDSYEVVDVLCNCERLIKHDSIWLGKQKEVIHFDKQSIFMEIMKKMYLKQIYQIVFHQNVKISDALRDQLIEEFRDRIES